MWTFVYKEVAICACAAVKQTGIPLDDLLMFYRAFGVNFHEICFLPRGGARLLGHALLLGHIRYMTLNIHLIIL